MPLAYDSANSKYPSSGQALVRGGNTTIRVTMMPFQRVKLELDLDGDSSFEITIILHWVAVLLGLELIDSDGDAMHDRWEVIHGFNPLDAADALQDADNDGYSNVDEYLGGSNPHLAISVPKFQKSEAEGSTLIPEETQVSISVTQSANASDEVSPGDSIPNKLINPATPCSVSSCIAKSTAGKPGPFILGRIPA